MMRVRNIYLIGFVGSLLAGPFPCLGAEERGAVPSSEALRPSVGGETKSEQPVQSLMAKEGHSPAEAWKNLQRSWQGNKTNTNSDVYSPVTAILARDFLPGQGFPSQQAETRGDEKKFKVLTDGDYAVIYFGNRPGRENIPVLFCRTIGGWQWDAANQRKYIRLNASLQWGVERTAHPYVGLLSRCPFYMGMDLPLGREDFLSAENQETVARRIEELEKNEHADLKNFAVLLEQARLNILVGRKLPEAAALLGQAKQLNPQSPLPYKYAAVLAVNDGYRYQEAVAEIREYIQRAVDDALGYNFLGYLYYQLGEFEKAEPEFFKALQFDHKNIYAYEKLARTYGELFIRTSGESVRRERYRQESQAMWEKAQALAGKDHLRVMWLTDWLRQKTVLERKGTSR